MNGIDYFDRGWRLNRDGACMIHAETGDIYTYDQVRERTHRVAQALHARGYGVGAKAAVLSYNHPIGFSVVLSLLRAGTTWIPVNPRVSIPDNAAILDAFDCDVLFFSASFATSIPAIAQVAQNIRALVCIDERLGGYEFIDDWEASSPDREFDTAHDPERVLAIQPTGGTTGFPKGVMLANRGLENIVSCLMAVAPCAERPVYLAAAPLTHAGGWIFHYVMAHGGAGIVFPKIDRKALLEAIPRFKATHIFLPPTVIYDLLEVPNVRQLDYSSLRYFIYGASPVAPERLREAVRTFGPVMCQVYGQTESGFPNTFLSAADHFANGTIASPDRLASCGQPSPFSRAAIMGDDGTLLGHGKIGELVVRGQGVMLGYYKNAEATEEVSQHGWHHTGDVGYQDREGYFYIVDRKRDMIISGGFNIYCVEVEQAVSAHPGVQECAVLGVPHRKWGEAVQAVVQLRQGAKVTADDIIAFCKERIGGMKSPKFVDFCEALPKSANGKILKCELKRHYWEGRDRLVS